MQDCRKYKEYNWLGVEEDKQIDKIMRALVIESQSHFSSKLCREIYRHIKVGEIFGPLGLRDSHGQWVENDHEYVRAVACDLTEGDLASFLSGRDALCRRVPMQGKPRKAWRESDSEESPKDL